MPSDLNSEMLKSSKPAIESAKKKIDKDLDYSVKSLNDLEMLLHHIKNYILSLENDGKSTYTTLKQVSFFIGAYLGEVIKRQIGGTWITKDNNTKVLVVDGIEFFPITYVHERLSKDTGYSLGSYYSDVVNRHRGLSNKTTNQAYDQLNNDDLTSNPLKYKKLENAQYAPTKDRFIDIKIRAGHYYQYTRKFALQRMKLSKILNTASLLLMVAVTIFLTLQISDIVSGKSVVWVLTILSGFSGIITVFQIVSIDDGVTAKLFHISMEFYEIKERSKTQLSQIYMKSESTNYDEFKKLSKDYKELLAKYVEHLKMDYRYFYRSRGPGRVKLENTGLYHE